MRIRILSDLHLELTRYIPHEIEGVDVVVLAGDISYDTHALEWIAAHFPDTPVIYVAGNHELYGESLESVHRELRAKTCGSNVYILERDEVVIDGVRFLGATLWADFELFGPKGIAGAMAEARSRMPDFKGLIEYVSEDGSTLSAADARQLHFVAREWLKRKLATRFDGKTVVVTHHAPSFASIHPDFQCDPLAAWGASRLDHLVELADLWIHGHVHAAADYEIGKCRVVCNPRGNPRERTGFRSGLVVEV